MRGTGLRGIIVAGSALLVAACASTPVPVTPAPPMVRAIAITGAAPAPELTAALAGLANEPLTPGLRNEAAQLAASYYAWLEWHGVQASAAETVDASGTLVVEVSGSAPRDPEPAPEEYFEIAMPFGPSVASDVPAPREPSGARIEAQLDGSFAFWLESKARVLIDAGERRLYVKRPADIVSYAVAVGTRRTPTPAGEYWVEGIRHKPTWYPPASIRREHAAKGKPLPRVVPPGRGNPLGDWFVRLQNSIGIHGTNQPRSIGSAASHGCIRMHDADVGELVKLLRNGDSITIVRNRPAPAVAGGGSPAQGGAAR